MDTGPALGLGTQPPPPSGGLQCWTRRLPAHRCLSLHRMDISALQRLLEQGRDSALPFWARPCSTRATPRRRSSICSAVSHRIRYSAGWKWLGKAHLAAGDSEAAAAQAWQQGSAVAGTNGDKQAVKEMAVFLRRLQRKAGAGPA